MTANGHVLSTEIEGRNRIYENRGNWPLVELLGTGCQRVLDVGCGAGDNAALVKARYPGCRVFGITHGAAEADVARRHLEQCWVFDIEGELPEELAARTFDTLMFSHVLEHLRDPALVLSRFTPLLEAGGAVLIAVPNVLSWRQRVQFLQGRFEYEPSGVLDDTHLRFFTYFTADHYLLGQSPELQLRAKQVTGSVPLCWLRRHLLPNEWSLAIDSWGCRHWPNLFGGQILLKATKV